MSSQGEFRVWTGEVGPGFQEVLCAVTPRAQISRHFSAVKDKPLQKVAEGPCGAAVLPMGQSGCGSSSSLPLFAACLAGCSPPALLPPAVRCFFQLSDWRIFLTQGIGQHPLVQALSCIPALGSSHSSHSTLLAAELQPLGCFSPDKSSMCGFSDTTLCALVVP